MRFSFHSDGEKNTVFVFVADGQRNGEPTTSDETDTLLQTLNVPHVMDEIEAMFDIVQAGKNLLNKLD